MISTLLLALATATASPYPEAAITESFRKVCLSHQSEGEMVAAARADGWKPYGPPPGTPFAAMVDIQKNWAEESGVASKISTFTRDVNGITVSLLVDRTAPFEKWTSRVDCAVFDFAAANRLSDTAVSTVRSERADKFHTSEQIWFRQWDSADGKTSVRIGFVPVSSPLVKQIGIVGSSLQASYNSETN